MNWHMIIPGLIVVVLKVIGMTFFLLHFSQIFGKDDTSVLPTTESYGTVPQTFGKDNISIIPTTENYGTVPQTFGKDNISIIPTTESYGTECPRGWNLHSGRCFFLSTTELPWENSKKSCEDEGSSLAIANTDEKLKFLQDSISADKYFIGLMYQPSEKRWRWINNSAFTGNITGYNQNFHCVTIGLTRTLDSTSCDVSYRWICEKKAK